MPLPIKALNPIELARQALSPAQDDAEEQRVIELFRNRAELKKAYVELQDEIHRLKDRLKQQEGATARVRELLEHLEARLATVESGYPTLVFYQLRSLWSQGSDLLRSFGTDLERQHVERERRAFVAEVNRRQFARRQEAESTLREAEAVAAETVQRTQALQRSLAALNRPWHHFKRRRVRQELDAARMRESGAAVDLAAARETLERVLGEGEVPFPGLPVSARRSVNLAVIAYAEVLVQRLARTPLLGLARAAVLRREPTDEYGTRVECEALMAQIAQARNVLGQRTQLGQEIKARVEKLAAVASYRSDDDTVPVPESVATSGDAPATARPQGADVPERALSILGDDVLDVFKALLR